MSEQETDRRIEVFYDGECPLCMKEIRLLRRLDRRARIRFTDISADGFSPQILDRTMTDFMDEIHGRLPNGQWITGVEVFRQLYAAVGLGVVGLGVVGLGALVSLTRLPGVSWGLDVGYRVFAKNRLRLTGRCNAESCGTNAVSSGSSQTMQ